MGINQGMSWKTISHYQQCSVMDRMQEYADKWQSGKYEMPLVPVETIDKVPIAMFIGSKDTTCPLQQALDHSKLIKSSTTSIIVDGKDHDYFVTASEKGFIDSLIDQMQIDDLTPEVGGWDFLNDLDELFDEPNIQN